MSDMSWAVGVPVLLFCLAMIGGAVLVVAIVGKPVEPGMWPHRERARDCLAKATKYADAAEANDLQRDTMRAIMWATIGTGYAALARLEGGKK